MSSSTSHAAIHLAQFEPPERQRSYAVVIPVHNEEEHLDACLSSVCAAALLARRRGHTALVIVVLDRCTDRSADIAARYPVSLLTVDVGNVGAARALGADVAIELGASWLAFTDADTRVASDWLLSQATAGNDAFCGTVEISDWARHSAELGTELRRAFEAGYENRDGHRHVHGANLGISTEAYLAVGGFQALAVDEDVRLVEELVRRGYRVEWSAGSAVQTSSRVENRVSGGFGGFIATLSDRMRQGVNHCTTIAQPGAAANADQSAAA